MSEPIAITDHALVRWLEWEGFVDVAQLRRIIGGSLQRAVNAAAEIHVDNYSIIADGLVYLVRDGTLVTIREETPGNRVWAHRRQDVG